MLQKNTVSAATLELLNRIMTDEFFSEFILVGGTALALQLGHRKSIDVDLFCVNYFDEQLLLDHLRIQYSFELEYSAKSTLKGEIGGVKVDCLAHPYPWLQEPMCEGSIRLSGFKDLAAMKLNVVAVNGTRLKDFIDLAYLSSTLTLSNMLEAYLKKYNSSTMVPLKALTFFNDINYQEPIIMMEKSKFTWKTIEKRLLEMQRKPDQLFPPL
ncbi:MAG: nucleotidyl transferase AbiEii/AbiGii toxin family protein [Bacteroidia bacterium]|nr:nucleotidyl transferase AbiEii/AbiGii toxin family protein [Bacteroidia bacterium]